MLLLMLSKVNHHQISLQNCERTKKCSWLFRLFPLMDVNVYNKNLPRLSKAKIEKKISTSMISF